jgi:cephalosporin hydroxylase
MEPKTNYPNCNGIKNKVKNLVVNYSPETERKVCKCLQEVDAIQNYYEASQLCEQLVKLKPKVVLEIGVDIRSSIFDLKHLEKCNQSLTFVVGDTFSDTTLTEVKDLLDNEEVDFLFIDANHSYESVKNDYEKFSPLVRKGGIIAFHDIDSKFSKDITEGTTKFWKEISSKSASSYEFVNYEADVYFGIGMIIV